jgi:hypothetical protein
MTRALAAPHVHSTWSYDGRWELPDLAAAFGKRGYAVVLMAEHDRGWDEERWTAYRAACAEASAAGALVVPGIEYASPDDAVHVPVWGNLPFLGAGVETGALLERAAALGGTSVLAHPQRREAWRRFDGAWLDHLAGIELWNRKYDGWAPSRTAVDLMRDGLAAFVGLDFHSARQFFPLALELQLDGAPTVDGVYSALRERRFGATAFRRPVRRVASGATLTLARGVERVRRPVARRVRRALA